MLQGQLHILGAGASPGVPVVGCSCHVCMSTDSHNKRLRSAALLTYGDKSLLLDAGPDLRQQVLRYGLKQLDGIIITHAHYDHIAGLDDLRPLLHGREQPLPLLASDATLAVLQQMYGYLFKGTWFRLCALPAERGSLLFESLPMTYFTYEQANTPVNGFRFGDIAYVSDIRHYPASLIKELTAVRRLIISALRLTPSPMHFSVHEALAFAKACAADQVWLTHLAHEIDYTSVQDFLPANVQLAYDGLTLPFTVSLEE